MTRSVRKGAGIGHGTRVVYFASSSVGLRDGISLVRERFWDVGSMEIVNR